MKFLRLFLILFLITDACIDRYHLPEKLSGPRLVVDGMITDQPGPATIVLSESLDINTSVRKTEPVTGATVTIHDDAGNKELLQEVSAGVYQTSGIALKGVIGRKYHATIRIQEKEYVSDPQTLLPAGVIDDVYFIAEENVINDGDLTLPQNSVSILMNARGTPGAPNLFRWRWSATYEVKTFPELKTRLDLESRPPVEIPAPLPCSGYIMGDGGVIEKIDTCTCCKCWVDESGSRALISDNQFSENDSFRGVHVVKLPVDSWRFNIKYLIRIEQLSVSEEVYAFWKLVKAQQDGEGSLFQPNAVRVKGNVHSTTDPDEQVLGIFSVSAVTTKELSIVKDQIPFTMTSEIVAASCFSLFQGSSNIKPPNW
jgi:hypothetical protein